MKVRIVCYEDVHAWILGKFALRLNDHLLRLGVKSDISKVPDPQADINHHIIYYNYDGNKTTTETVMITHIDTAAKIELLRLQLSNAAMGICMSMDTVQHLAAAGLPRERLCFINPAHDEVMRPRKTVIGITSKVQPTGCKREYLLEQLVERISPDDFMFKIMGTGWDPIIKKMKTKGFEVEYSRNFDYKKYVRLVPSLDYYLYMGQDEGSMGFIDALAAGVRTIVTPQGYHLDAKEGITYAFNEIDELEKIFHEIVDQKKRLPEIVSTWTWQNYARHHLEVWEYLLSEKIGKLISPEAMLDLRKLGVETEAVKSSLG